MAERLAWAVLTGLVLLALAGPWLPLADPLATDVTQAMQPPGGAHLLGTDALGRDMLARIVAGARMDLGLACLAVGLAAPVGAAVGAVAGWLGGWPDRIGGWLADVLLALPIYLLAMVLAAAIGNSLLVVVLATAAVNLPVFVRLTRTEVARLRRTRWVDGLRMGGVGDRALLLRFVGPAVLPLLAVQATTAMGWAMLNAAGLSFIGIGVRPPTPEWGVLISEGARHLASGHWWLVACPAIALTGSVLAFHIAGDGLRDRLALRAAA